jgi:two-component system cell cycle response regulator CtrA
MITRIMLERAGYEVEDAADATEAWSRLLLANKPFAVMLLDISLPGRSGLELLHEVQEAKPALNVILTSGKDEEDYPNHGANAYLAKPFTRDQLVAVVQNVTRTVVI